MHTLSLILKGQFCPQHLTSNRLLIVVFKYCDQHSLHILSCKRLLNQQQQTMWLQESNFKHFSFSIQIKHSPSSIETEFQTCHIGKELSWVLDSIEWWLAKICLVTLFKFQIVFDCLARNACAGVGEKFSWLWITCSILVFRSFCFVSYIVLHHEFWLLSSFFCFKALTWNVLATSCWLVAPLAT